MRLLPSAHLVQPPSPLFIHILCRACVAQERRRSMHRPSGYLHESSKPRQLVFKCPLAFASGHRPLVQYWQNQVPQIMQTRMWVPLVVHSSLPFSLFSLQCFAFRGLPIVKALIFTYTSIYMLSIIVSVFVSVWLSKKSQTSTFLFVEVYHVINKGDPRNVRRYP